MRRREDSEMASRAGYFPAVSEAPDLDQIDAPPTDLARTTSPASLDDLLHAMIAIRATLASGQAELLTAKGAARFLGIGRSTLYRLAKTDRLLQPVRVGPSQSRRWRRTDLQTYIAKLPK